MGHHQARKSYPLNPGMEMPEMCAGAGNEGAQDAWWDAALDFEQATIGNEAFTGGTVDLYKCVAQVARPLLLFCSGMEVARRNSLGRT